MFHVKHERFRMVTKSGHTKKIFEKCEKPLPWHFRFFRRLVLSNSPVLGRTSVLFCILSESANGIPLGGIFRRKGEGETFRYTKRKIPQNPTKSHINQHSNQHKTTFQNCTKWIVSLYANYTDSVSRLFTWHYFGYRCGEVYRNTLPH